MYRLELVNIDNIQITEEHIPERVEWLIEKIKAEALWRVPLLLEENSYAIMDGHHRFEVAKKLGLRRVPAVMLNYNLPSVQVISWREDFVINKSIVQSYIKDKKIFPHKTTKHIIDPYPDEISIPISFLY
ncbi:ParB N-terminal domain-containing protein [Providencia sp. CRE-3FA-0001]|uniref:ParB N-terminal domain-containing protein n=1 Tax=Providencia huashanensis TaxID=3037798 RepID=A0AA42FLS1_9GAMM|nr:MULTISPECIES: ParB N-terminal domain-containing protein [unclassified Providencia]MDG4696929.1 ParB N-terminal domain-containing protein [Providencia sp. CRE-3FA-0001]WBA57561.1 ParB N-terminal domain-containing protein [Providencia sp. 21OH12SH02B-Prov]